MFSLILQFKEFWVSVQSNFDMCVFDHVYVIATWENYAKNVNMLNCMFNDCARLHSCRHDKPNRQGEQESEEQNDYILIIFGYCLSRPCVRLCSWESISRTWKRGERDPSQDVFAARICTYHPVIKYLFFFLSSDFKWKL